MTNSDTNFGLLLDFDGTVTTIDTLQYLLDHYGMRNWRELDRQVVNGSMKELDAMRMQMESLSILPADILPEIIKKIPLRSGFPEFVTLANQHQIPLRIVSAGFCEIINPYLLAHSIHCEVVANHITEISELTGWQIGASVQPLPECKHSHCKCRSEEWLRGMQRKVYFVGDGITDYCVAKRADTIFAVQGSTLEWLCNRDGLSCTPFQSFEQLSERLGFNTDNTLE